MFGALKNQTIMNVYSITLWDVIKIFKIEIADLMAALSEEFWNMVGKNLKILSKRNFSFQIT